MGRRIAAAAASKESDGRRRSRMLEQASKIGIGSCQQRANYSIVPLQAHKWASRQSVCCDIVRRAGLPSGRETCDGVPRDNVRAAVAARDGTLGHASGTPV